MYKKVEVFKAGSNGMNAYIEYLKTVVVILTIAAKIKETQASNIPGE